MLGHGVSWCITEYHGVLYHSVSWCVRSSSLMRWASRDEVVCAACVRFLGQVLAEMPLVATSYNHRRKVGQRLRESMMRYRRQGTDTENLSSVQQEQIQSTCST